jgi:hypothetical protein
MSIGDIVVYVVAAIALGAFALLMLNKLTEIARNWRDVVAALGIVAVIGVGGAVVLAILGVVVFVGVMAYSKINDQRMMQQCTTLYERQEKANAAPDDYFGRQLRQTVSDEAKQCAEYAARKEAAATSK